MATEEVTALTAPNASLYVGDLSPTVDEQVLIEKFSKVGAVYYARICRDISTKSSLGYGYVNFCDPNDAERALELMNYELIHNKPIRLMWSQRDPSLRKSGRGNIYIKNLAKDITQKELYDTFSCMGTILSCKIAMDSNGNSKGFGYIHFENEEHAEKAIEKINGMEILGQIVYVGHFVPRGSRQTGTNKPKFNNLYVKSFPPETTDETLREMFQEFGEIISCVVSVDGDGKSKGFGFVCFKDPDNAEAAVKAMHGKETNGRVLYVGRAQKKVERLEELRIRADKQKAERQARYIGGVNLYVKNLDDTIDDAALEEAFSRYGPITSAKVMRDAQGRSKGFGFVCFTQPEDAAKAVVQMSAFLLGSKPLYVAIAQRKEERRERLGGIPRHPQFRLGIPQMQQNAGANYFPQGAFHRAPPYYPQGVIPTQPRWNRPSGVPGTMAQLNVPRPMAGHYFPTGASLPAIAQLAQMRQPSLIRSMIPGGVPSGAPMVNNAVMHGQVRRPGPSMAQISANGMSPVVNNMQAAGQPRQVANQPLPRQVHMPFNQGGRPIAANQNAGLATVMSPLGDQLSVRPAPPTPHERKIELGERLFPLVSEFDQQRASKITGMLLCLGESDILGLLQSKDDLKAKVEEAVAVLDGRAKPSAEQSQNRGDVNAVPTPVGSKET